MIILSVDYGDVRTGIAVCDKNEMLASPVTVIKQSDAQKLCADIAEICKQYKVEMIVCGLPKNMDGSEGFRAAACKEFADLLHEETGLAVAMFDERLTTVSAHNYLNATNTRGKKRKETVDAVAATLILEDYLTYRKNKR
ncbi:MAG: Holliday junction resolvase RuvX [Ruminococcaceae bacterium]|nr:Holliday junction resolvase RuvX [Oscillospiraceae bacterium]